MGKIVKYCTVCEEGFAEKFSFCPNCAASLMAYEMNPLVSEQAKITEPVESADNINEPIHNFEANTHPVTTAQDSESAETGIEPETPRFLIKDEPEILDLHSDFEEAEEEPETLVFEPAVSPVISEPVNRVPTIGSFSQNYNAAESVDNNQYTVKPTIPASDFQQPLTPAVAKYVADSGYNITIVEEKNNSTRQMLLLGAFVLVMILTFGGVVVSLYTNTLNIGAITDDSVIAYLPADPDTIEQEEAPKPKTDTKAGGGGGGGKNDPTPVSQGEFARQTRFPTVPPSAQMDRVTDPALKQVVATEGPENNQPPKDRYGNPNSNFTIASDGPGTGGGQGTGNGRGQGGGNGNGRGNGNGTGIGDGNGNGIGDGNGNGVDGDPPAKKPTAPPVTTPYRILSKPKALYTDAGRQNQVQGSVRLRVVFQANGSIGSISVISGLPNGLTEQAIAAARAIKFEPQKVNGVAIAVTKQIDYSFTLY